MARRTRPWYRLNRGWYVTLDGKQFPLGITDPNDERAAFAAFKALLEALKTRPKAGSVADTVGRFMDRQTARGLSQDTLVWYRNHLARLVAQFGTTPVGDLDPEKVAAACNRQKGWGPDTRRNYLSAVETLFRFAGREVKFDKPPRGSAGARAVIPESTYLMAIGSARGDLRGLLTVLWNTGARPKEVRLLEVEQVDWSAGVASLDKHKTARRTGKPRLLVFPPPAMDVLTAQREKYRAGLLFRTRNGTAYTCPGLAQAVWRISGRIGRPLFAYALRHTFATEALAKGVPETHVASLLGHSSTAMLNRHYAHLTSQTQLLKDAAAKVRPAG